MARLLPLAENFHRDAGKIRILLARLAALQISGPAFSQSCEGFYLDPIKPILPHQRRSLRKIFLFNQGLGEEEPVLLRRIACAYASKQLFIVISLGGGEKPDQCLDNIPLVRRSQALRTDLGLQGANGRQTALSGQPVELLQILLAGR